MVIGSPIDPSLLSVTMHTSSGYFLVALLEAVADDAAVVCVVAHAPKTSAAHTKDAIRREETK